MPTVLRVDGFDVMIFLPTREHPPAHVHVYKQDDEVVILLGTDRVSVREINGMRRADVHAAVAIVDEHAEMLRALWRKYHG